MRFLFVVQGEGRGHLTQALAMERLLTQAGHEVVEMLVGKSNSRQLPGFFNRNVRAAVSRFDSPNFLPSATTGRANLTKSITYNMTCLTAYWHSIRFIREKIEHSGADAVINFYELLVGMTYALHRIRIPQICIGHQYLFLHHDFKTPFQQHVDMQLLRLFTRMTAWGAARKLALSFHTLPVDREEKIVVVPPLLRREVLSQKAVPGDYVHGYMLNPGFVEQVKAWHARHPEVSLRFFWDKSNAPAVKKVDETLTLYQIDDVEFLKQMRGCGAYATTAGFESICEAMYWGKPILMVPAHIEQECNAWDAARNGAGIISDDFNLDRLLDFARDYRPDKAFQAWVQSAGEIILSEIEAVVHESMPDEALVSAAC